MTRIANTSNSNMIMLRTSDLQVIDSHLNQTGTAFNRLQHTINPVQKSMNDHLVYQPARSPSPGQGPSKMSTHKPNPGNI